MSGNLDHPFIGGVPGSGRSPAETEGAAGKMFGVSFWRGGLVQNE